MFICYLIFYPLTVNKMLHNIAYIKTHRDYNDFMFIIIVIKIIPAITGLRIIHYYCITLTTYLEPHSFLLYKHMHKPQWGQK